MAKQGDAYVLPGGVRATMEQAPSQNGYRLLELVFDVPVGQRLLPLPHQHIDIPEHFAVLGGTARHWLGRRRLVAHAGDAWEVPPRATHIHPANIGDTPLVVRQWLEHERGDERLLGGLERYVEAIAAFAAQGMVDRFWRIKDPLQDALVLRETVTPGTYFPLVPTGWQDALLGGLAEVARKRGRVAVPA